MATKIPRVIADLELQLSTAVAIGGTSFTLSSAEDDDGNALPAGVYVFTVDAGTSNKEYLLGQLNGTDVTSVQNVTRQGVQSSGADRAHRVGAPVILTNFAALQLVADTLRGTVDLDAASPLSYDAEPTLSDNKELATVGYVLSVVTGGAVSFDKQTIAGTAGATIAAGDLIYLDEADQEWKLCDADTAATVEGVMRGIALGSGTDGVAITGGVHLAGAWTTTGLTAGALYYASNTAGDLATSAGTVKHIVGVALSTTRLWVIPQHRETIPTRTKDALVGDGATPSVLNPFTTKNRTMTAGGTINGATLPVPVYQNKTDNEFYACDANDNTAYKFIGFAVSNATDGNTIQVQFNGIVNGFTGLSEGEKYYVQDTVGTIGTSIGTQEILVGIAISETELLIQRGKLRAAGSQSSVINATGSIVVSCGFRPSVVRVRAQNIRAASTSAFNTMTLTWVNGVLNAIYSLDNGVSSGSGNSALLYDTVGGDRYLTFSIDSVTDTGFTISYTETSDYNISTQILWEAEGEL